VYRLAALLLFAFPGWAGLIVFQLNPSLEAAPPGGLYQPLLCQNSDGSGACVIFSGTITFTNDQEYTLTDVAVQMDPGNIDGGAQVFENDYGNYFYLNVPGTMGSGGAGTTYTGGIFEIDIASDAPLGVYLGTATLDYTDSLGDTFSSDPQAFEVDVTPEPAAWSLMAGGLAALLFRRRRAAEG